MLTGNGKKTATLILRKHRLTEMYLVDKIGLGWEEVHEIAEQVEHIESPIFFDRMDELMNYPMIDPHGSPIPDKEGNMEIQDYKRLNECRLGVEVIISVLSETSKEFLEFLDSRGLILGTRMKVASISEFDGSMMVSIDGKNESLSAKVSERLLVNTL